MNATQMLTPKALFRRSRFEKAVARTSPAIVYGWGQFQTGDDLFIADSGFAVHDVPVVRMRGGEVVHLVEHHVVIPREFVRFCGMLHTAVHVHLYGDPDPVVETIIPGKAPGKVRRVVRCSYVDRVCQHLFLLTLAPQIEPQFSSHLHSFRPEHDRFTALRDTCAQVRHGYPWGAAVDIVKYYDSTPVDAAVEAVVRLCPQIDPMFRLLLDQALRPWVLRRPNHPGRRDGTLPPESPPLGHLLAGAPISPFLSNAVGAIALDAPYTAALGDTAKCVRYADNLLVLAPTEAACAHALGVLQDLIEAGGWHLHPGEDCSPRDVRRDPLPWLGLELAGGRARTPEAQFRKYVARLAAADPTSADFSLLAHGILGALSHDRPRRVDDLARAVRQQAPAQAAALRRVMSARQARQRGHQAPPWTPISTIAPRDLPEAAWN